jgi:hypothetical protein
VIYYRPLDGEVVGSPVKWRPRTAFVMQALGKPIPPEVVRVRKAVNAALTRAKFKCIDAKGSVTGRDLLLKVWEFTVSCPLGIAIIHEGVSPATLANIYYELGLMQAYGRETVVVKVGSPSPPSDFVRTEYIEAGKGLPRSLKAFLASVRQQADHYEFLAQQLANNPLLAIDYLRRSYLLTERRKLRVRAKEIFRSSGLESRAPISVERLLARF